MAFVSGGLFLIKGVHEAKTSIDRNSEAREKLQFGDERVLLRERELTESTKKRSLTCSEEDKK